MKRVLRLPELVELATDPAILEKMIAELGVEQTRLVLELLRAKAEAWARDADEMDLDDSRRM
jgi:hypothetical protein